MASDAETEANAGLPGAGQPISPEAARASAGKSKAMGRAAAKGAAFSGLTQGTKIAVTMISTIIVARILSPADYGVIAMTTPVTGFILLFQNLGLNQATAQAREITDEQTNAMFFYNVAASAIIALVLVLLAPVIGWFYGDARPAYVMAASAVTVIMTGLALQHSAMLIRQMRFRELSFVEMTSSITTLLFTIGYAVLFRSYWALWLGAFCGTLVSRSMLWRFVQWRPSRAIVWSSAREMVSFGTNVTKFNIVNYLSRNVDNVLIARFWGSSSLGLYDRSYKLMMFPLVNINFPLSRVMLPVLSRLIDEPERYRRAFLLALRVITLVSVPGVLAATLCSHELVPFLLGKRWAAAAPIFFWLGLAGLVQPIQHPAGWLFLSDGRARDQFRWGVIAAPLNITSFVVGLPWGAVGVAAAYFVMQTLLVGPGYYFATRRNHVRPTDVLLTLLPLAVGAAATAAVTLLVIGHHLSPLGRIAAVSVLSYGFAVGAQFLTAEGRDALLHARSTFLSFRKPAQAA